MNNKLLDTSVPQWSNVEAAKRTLAYELELYAIGKPEWYFDPRNQDDWIRAFCDHLKEKQRKRAEVRASND